MNPSLLSMRIGVPGEIKNRGYRVGLAPPGAPALVAAGNDTHRDPATDVNRACMPATGAPA
jgi:hypothetical protein